MIKAIGNIKAIKFVIDPLVYSFRKINFQDIQNFAKFFKDISFKFLDL